MLELIICSLVTILPDYLYRRYVQGKRLGKEITFYSVWFELRWGITGCLMLTIGLITTVFFFIPRPATRRCSSGPFRFSPKRLGVWPRSISATALR